MACSVVCPVVAVERRTSTCLLLIIGITLSLKISCPTEFVSGVITYIVPCWFIDMIPDSVRASARYAPTTSVPSIQMMVSTMVVARYS